MDNSDSRTDDGRARACDPDSCGLSVPTSPASDSASNAGHALFRRRPFSSRWLWVALVSGTLIRIVALPVSSPDFNLPFWDTYGWPADHATYVQWARQATDPDKGLLTMYTEPPEPGFTVRLSAGDTYVHHGLGEIANYPPLSFYVLWLQGKLHRLLDPEMVTNTAVARVVFGSASFLGDILLALGVWTLCAYVFDRRTAAIATAIVYLIPPIWLDSCWWGQTDSWELAPMVWVVWAMIRRRWFVAGVLWGIGLSLKPQAILLAPVWLFIWLDILFTRSGDDGEKCSKGELGRIVVAVLIAVAVLNLTALPFWLSSGSAWLEQSYLRNLGDEQPYTTLKAFNIWYLDLLRTYDADAATPIAGIAKDTWGKILAFAGLVMSAVIAWRQRGSTARRVLLFTGLWLLAVVMLPTRVHERYILMCLPFLIMLAAGLRRLWPGVVALIVIGCFQLTVFHWLMEPADSWTKKWITDTINYHRNTVAQTPPELRHQLPSLDQALQMRFANFLQEHTSFATLEWGLSILACFATGFVFYRAWQARHRSAQ